MLISYSDKTSRPLKLAFGTCVIFVRTQDQVYVAADTLRTTIEEKDDGSEVPTKESVCKIGRLGTSTYFASSGLYSFDHPRFEVRESCIRLFDPRKSIRENIELIAEGLYGEYLEITKYVANQCAAKGTIKRFDRFKTNRVHIALFGIENESPLISAVEFIPSGPLDPTVEIRKGCNLAPNPELPIYVMGCERLINGIALRIGGALPEFQNNNIVEWLEAAMRWCFRNQGAEKTIGEEIAILKVGIGGEEDWPRRPHVCKDS